MGTLLAAPLAILFVWLTSLNWIALVARLRRPDAPSWIPLVAGLAGAAACVLQPLAEVRSLWWLPFLIDAGSVPGLALTAIWLARRKADRYP